jgi:RNAse (barnase) inhibitor barstar
MAEEEKIQQHAKRALRSLTNKKKKWKERIKDFLYEILIIIVAVSLTLGFHNWSDRRSDRKLVKEFLIDVRENLMQDTAILNDNINFMDSGPIAYYDSVLAQISRNKINAGYIDSNSVQLVNHISLYFNYGVFQSFSSSGNLRLIENRALLSDITNLYSSDLPFYEQGATRILDTRYDEFKKYIGTKVGIDSNFFSRVSTIIHQPEVKFQFQENDLILKQENKHHKSLINEIISVIHEIDKELKDNFNYEVPLPSPEGEK